MTKKAVKGDKDLKNKFKAGDVVYFPSVSSKPQTLKAQEEVTKTGNKTYPLILEIDDEGIQFIYSFTKDGRLGTSEDDHPKLFLASKENIKKFEELFGYKLEA